MLKHLFSLKTTFTFLGNLTLRMKSGKCWLLKVRFFFPRLLLTCLFTFSQWLSGFCSGGDTVVAGKCFLVLNTNVSVQLQAVYLGTSPNRWQNFIFSRWLLPRGCLTGYSNIWPQCRFPQWRAARLPGHLQSKLGQRSLNVTAVLTPAATPVLSDAGKSKQEISR